MATDVNASGVEPISAVGIDNRPVGVQRQQVGTQRQIGVVRNSQIGETFIVEVVKGFETPIATAAAARRRRRCGR